jgi:hypothetical protein
MYTNRCDYRILLDKIKQLTQRPLCVLPSLRLIFTAEKGEKEGLQRDNDWWKYKLKS